MKFGLVEQGVAEVHVKSLGPDIWIQEQTLKAPLFGNIGSKMTVIRLQTGELMLISPVRLTSEIQKELQNLGPVRYLVGPNSMHHLSLNQYKNQYPEAVLVGPLKLQKKRPEIPFQLILEEGQKFQWSEELDMVLVDTKGSMNEAVFFHRPSQTLIVTDLIFNLQKVEGNIPRWAHKLNGSYQHLGMTKMGRFLWNDRVLLKKKVQEISKWSFKQIVLAHGEIVVEDGKNKFVKSFSWLEH